MLGSVIADISCIFQSGLSSTTPRPLVASSNLACCGVDRTAVDLGQQILHILRNHIGDALLERRGRSQRGGLTHGLLSPICVPTSQLGERANVSDRVIDALARGSCRRIWVGLLLRARRSFRWRPWDAGRRQGNRCGRAEVRARRHGGYVRRVHEIGAGTRGPATVGGNVHDNGNRRSQDGVDHFSCGAQQPAGCVDSYDHGRRPKCGAFLGSFCQLPGGDEANCTLDIDQNH